MDYAVNKAGLKDVYLTTNAILINRNDTYKKLIDLGIAAVFISTQGASKEVYEKIYGVKRYDEAMSGIRNLMEYNHSKGEPARIVVRFRNHEKPSQIIRSPDFKKNIQPYLVRARPRQLHRGLRQLGRNNSRHGHERFHAAAQIARRRSIVPCKNLFNFAVRHDGKVRLCGCRLATNDNDDLVVGNIKDRSLAEISKGDEAWAIIKGFYEGKRPETCVACTFYQPINPGWFEQRAKKNGAANCSGQ